MVTRCQLGVAFGVKLPSGFGYDYSGVVDEVGANVTGFSKGDRIFGGKLCKAVADYLIVDPTKDDVYHTPKNVDDITASTFTIAGKTAAAAIDSIKISKGDTLLIGGAAEGVGVFAVQLAILAGARVIGTASEKSFETLRKLGAEPITYGEGLIDRVRAIAPKGITAAADLFGTETILTALELGVSPDRISSVASHDPQFASKVKATGGSLAEKGTLERIANLVNEGKFVVPIAATFPIEKIRDAVELQATRHVIGKVVVTL